MLLRNPAIKIIGKRNEREFGFTSNHATSCIGSSTAAMQPELNQDSARVGPLVGGQQPELQQQSYHQQNPHRFNLAASSSSKTQEEASSRLEALLNTSTVNQCQAKKKELKKSHDHYDSLKSSQFQSRLPR